MHEFVGQRMGELLEHFLRVLTFGQQLRGTLELVAAHAFGLIAQRANGGHQLAGLEPVHEIVNTGIDDRFRLRYRRLPGVETFLNDLAEVVHAVKKHVVELGHFCFYVARHRQIDHQYRPVPARLDRAFDHAFAEDRQLACGTGHYDVVHCQLLGHIVEGDRLPLVAGGQFLAAFQRAIGKSRVARLFGGKVRGTEFDHFAGSDEQHFLLAYARKNAFGDLYRGGGHRHRVSADLGLGAHFFRHRERRLEKLVKHGAERASMLGGLHRIFHLPEDLRLAQHHGIQPARHPERVRDCALPWQHIKKRLERLRLEMMKARQPIDRAVGFRGAAVDLGAVAGGNDRGLPDRLAVHQVAQRFFQIGGVESHLLANRERGRVMIDAESKKLHRNPETTRDLTAPERPSIISQMGGFPLDSWVWNRLSNASRTYYGRVRY